MESVYLELLSAKDFVNAGRLLRLSELLYREGTINSAKFMDHIFTRDDILSDPMWDEGVRNLKYFYNHAKYAFPKNNDDTIKIKHVLAFGTLEKFKEKSDLSRYMKRLNFEFDNFVITPKLDGVSCRLFYKDCKLIYATNRHDKEFGIQITSKVINIVPNKITVKKEIAIRGELLYIGKDIQTTARNKIAGLITDSSATLEDCIFVPYEAIDVAKKCQLFTKFTDTLDWLKLNKFIPIVRVESKDSTLTSLLEIIKPIDLFITPDFKLTNVEDRGLRHIETDGIVIQPSSFPFEEVKNSKGEFAAPKYQIAFKFPTEQLRETTINGVSFDCSYGFISPVITLDPVTIDEKTISRVSPGTFTKMEERSLFIGSKVMIGFSNEVIPYIANVISIGKNKNIYPLKCPVCGSKCNRVKDKNTIKYQCSNDNCPSYFSYILNRMKIKGIGNVTRDNLAKLLVDKKFDDPLLLKWIRFMIIPKDFGSLSYAYGWSESKLMKSVDPVISNARSGSDKAIKLLYESDEFKKISQFCDIVKEAVDKIGHH